MKTSQNTLAWGGLFLAVIAGIVSLMAFARTYVVQKNLDALKQTSSSTTTNDQTYRPIEQVRAPIAVPQDLGRLGFVPVECSEEDLARYLETNDFVLLREECGAAGGTLWAYFPATNELVKRQVRYQFGASGPSPDAQIQMVLGPEQSTGEVQTLLVKDFVNDTEGLTQPLPATLTYKKGTSEFDGSPYGRIEWTDSGQPFAEVYDARIPLGLWDERLPVLRQLIPIR